MNKDLNPSAANFAINCDIFTNAAVNITTAGPPRKLPIALKNPLMKTLPFSGSKALSRNSVNFVATPTRFSIKGPKVTEPILSAKLVSP